MADLLKELNTKLELSDVIYQEQSFLKSICYENEVEEKIRLSNIELCERFLNHVR